MLEKCLRFTTLVCLAVAFASNAQSPAQAASTTRISPPVSLYLPTDEPLPSSTFVERLSSGFYIDWTGWLNATASELEPIINSVATVDIIRTAVIKPLPLTILKADLTLKSDGRILSLILDGQHCYARSQQKLMEGLRLPPFPIGSELATITVRFDLTQHQITVVPELRQIAGNSTVH
jgi:hypothetical protein